MPFFVKIIQLVDEPSFIFQILQYNTQNTYYCANWDYFIQPFFLKG